MMIINISIIENQIDPFKFVFKDSSGVADDYCNIDHLT